MRVLFAIPSYSNTLQWKNQKGGACFLFGFLDGIEKTEHKSCLARYIAYICCTVLM